jgi:hypothetical protein
VIHRDRDGNGLVGQWVVTMVVLGSMAVVAGAQENPVDEIGQSKESITKEDSTTDGKSGIEAVLDHIERSARETGDQIAKTIQKMRDVQSRVNKTDTGRETQQLQKQILSDLDSLIQATRQQQQRQQRQNPPDGEPESGPQQDTVSLMAQLMLLRSLQQDLHDRTVILQTEREQAGSLTEQQQADMQLIAEEQGALADLAEALAAEVASPGDGPDVDADAISDEFLPELELQQ